MSFIPDLWRDELAKQGLTPEWFAAVRAAEDRAPRVIAEAVHLTATICGVDDDTAANAIRACLSHLADGYVGDVDLERALGWMPALIDQRESAA